MIEAPKYKGVPTYFVIYDGYSRASWKTREELDDLQKQGRVIWAKHKDNRDMELGRDNSVVEIIDKSTVKTSWKEIDI